MKDTYTGESRSFGFISFASAEDAQRAQAQTNYMMFDGYEIRTNIKRLPTEFKVEANIFVKNLPKTMTN